MRDSELATRHQDNTPEALEARHMKAAATFERLSPNPIFEGQVYPVYLGAGRTPEEMEAFSAQERERLEAKVAKQQATIAERRKEPSNMALEVDMKEDEASAVPENLDLTCCGVLDCHN